MNRVQKKQHAVIQACRTHTHIGRDEAHSFYQGFAEEREVPESGAPEAPEEQTETVSWTSGRYALVQIQANSETELPLIRLRDQSDEGPALGPAMGSRLLPKVLFLSELGSRIPHGKTPSQPLTLSFSVPNCKATNLFFL